MNKARFRNLRIFLAYVFMGLGLTSVLLQWHFIFPLIFTVLMWLTNFQNYSRYSYNLEYVNNILGVVLIGIMMDYYSEIPLFTVAMVLAFPSIGGVRNRFPFLIATNELLWMEKLSWIVSLGVYIIALYYNSWKWNYLGYIFRILFLGQFMHGWLELLKPMLMLKIFPRGVE